MFMTTPKTNRSIRVSDPKLEGRFRIVRINQAFIRCACGVARSNVSAGEMLAAAINSLHERSIKHGGPEG